VSLRQTLTFAAMKVLPFTIPLPHDHTIIVQEEVLPHFYTYLHRHAESVRSNIFSIKLSDKSPMISNRFSVAMEDSSDFPMEFSPASITN
jgi:hypothetical protein